MGYDSDTGDGFGYVSWNTCLTTKRLPVKGLEQALIREGRHDEHFCTGHHRLWTGILSRELAAIP